ncbi:hypothetical protein KBD49_04515 [Myxococcota bacterium]|nr:hypothetical protein [Myxococcota bacterium]
MRSPGIRLLALAAALAVLLDSCSDDECAVEDDHCRGNVAWVCNGGGDKGPLKWETWDCDREGLLCRNGACFAEPLVPCDPGDAGQWTCDPEGRMPGRCSEQGFWGWDASHRCEPDRNETCATGRITQDGQEVTLALCVLDPPSDCSPGTATRRCQGDLVIECTPIGLWGITTDCHAAGETCFEGTCSAPQ